MLFLAKAIGIVVLLYCVTSCLAIALYYAGVIKLDGEE